MNEQLALAMQLSDEATLADFNWKNNALLQQQLSHHLTSKSEKLLYLWGPKGCGKSHLLQACCQAVHSSESAIYVPLTLLKEWGPNTLEGLEEQTLVCIDDVDVIAENSLWEEGLFHLYNKIKDMDENILILSGSQAPSNMPIGLADLRSRLGGALVIQVNELSDEEKINTLKCHAIKRGFDLTIQVSQFLINRCSRNMHDLIQLLNKLDNASLAAQRKITIPFVKRVLNL